MEGAMICSKCKESMGLLESVQTQTFEADWIDEDITAIFDLDSREENEQDCGTVETACEKDTIHLEDIQFVEQNQRDDPLCNVESLEYAVFQDVSDEAFDMDAVMELGTFAEMCHESDKIVAITRSFECLSHVKRRWQLAANVGTAANRLGRLKKENNSQVNEGGDILSESDDFSGLSGCRRIVISNGRFAISRQGMDTVGKEGELLGAAKERQKILGVYDKMQGINEELLSGKEDGVSNIEGNAMVHEEGHISKDEVIKASHIIGPNKRCLQLHEQEEEVDPEHNINLFDTDETMYNVVVVTRSFECGALTDSERAKQNWNRVKNVSNFSKALNRLKPSNHQRENDPSQSLFESDEKNVGPFVGSGYRRMSMKTIEEVASLARKRVRR